jgi:hypothetical protein
MTIMERLDSLCIVPSDRGEAAQTTSTFSRDIAYYGCPASAR